MAPSTSLRERKKDASRRAIEDAAWELFAQRGYDNTSINDIAERADVAPRTFFRYFPHKEAVLYGEFEGAVERLRAEFTARPVSEPLLTSVFATLETVVDHMASLPQERRLVFESMKRAQTNGGGEYFRNRLTEVVAELVVERRAGCPDASMEARLASGIVGLVMDVARQQCLAQGDMEAISVEGRRCLGVLSDIVSAADLDAPR